MWAIVVVAVAVVSSQTTSFVYVAIRCCNCRSRRSIVSAVACRTGDFKLRQCTHRNSNERKIMKQFTDSSIRMWIKRLDWSEAWILSKLCCSSFFRPLAENGCRIERLSIVDCRQTIHWKIGQTLLRIRNELMTESSWPLAEQPIDIRNVKWRSRFANENKFFKKRKLAEPRKLIDIVFGCSQPPRLESTHSMAVIIKWKTINKRGGTQKRSIHFKERKHEKW